MQHLCVYAENNLRVYDNMTHYTYIIDIIVQDDIFSLCEIPWQEQFGKEQMSLVQGHCQNLLQNHIIFINWDAQSCIYNICICHIMFMKSGTI